MTKKKNFMGVDGVSLGRVVFEFNQDSDTNQEGDLGQSIKIFTEDSGGGCYVNFSTERWSINPGDINKFAETLKQIVNLPEVRG